MTWWNERPRDENGWRIPHDGTMSRKFYDLTIAGKSAKEIALETGAEVNLINCLLVQLQPPRPRKPRFRNIHTSQPVAAPIQPVAPLDYAALNSLINNLDAIRSRNGVLPAEIEKTRQHLLHDRLVIDMRKFAQRLEPDRAKYFWSSFVEGIKRHNREMGTQYSVPDVLDEESIKAA